MERRFGNDLIDPRKAGGRTRGTSTRRGQSYVGLSAEAMAGSNHGQAIATASASVATPISQSVDAEGRAARITASRRTHTQPNKTRAVATIVIAACAAPNQANAAPKPPSPMAGIASGTTQHTPQATATVATAAAVAPTFFPVRVLDRPRFHRHSSAALRVAPFELYR